MTTLVGRSRNKSRPNHKLPEDVENPLKRLKVNNDVFLRQLLKFMSDKAVVSRLLGRAKCV